MILKMDTKELLDKRRMLKKKKPEFIRQDAHIKKKVGWKWRKPKGSDSKMRVSKKGNRRSVRKGWGSPSIVRGLDRNGLAPIIVDSVKSLDNVDPKTQTIVLSHGLGTKKKIEIVEKAIQKNIKISNLKDPQAFLKESKENFENRKKEKKQVKEERDKKKEAAKKEAEKKKAEEKKAADKGDEEQEMTEEEKKMEEKKEKDKLLISGQ